MRFFKIKSYAKINLSLNVIKKLKNNYHNIESLITFISLSDEIFIRPIKLKKNKVFFYGTFSKGINRNNSILKTFKILKKFGLIKNKYFEIKVKKNIPQKSGMGGGSMNSASILGYLLKKKIINISKNKLYRICGLIGSDVILGLKRQNTILFKSNKVCRLKLKTNLFVLIVKQRLGCSTKDIYENVYNFSKSEYRKKDKNYFKIDNLIKSHNDLEYVAYKKYPKLKNLNSFLSKIPNVIFTRMTGSGSAIVTYFKSNKALRNGVKQFRSKYKNYWYITSKTI